MRPDSGAHRDLLYEAEDYMMVTNGLCVPYESLADVQAVVDRILATDWWRTRSMYRDIRVVDGPYKGGAEADVVFKKMVMPAKYRLYIVVLHELAHFLTDINCADHGPEFAHNYVAMVREFVNPETADSLCHWLTLFGVPYRCATLCDCCGKATVFRADRRRHCASCAGRLRNVKF